jgi:hypothetical protein
MFQNDKRQTSPTTSTIVPNLSLFNLRQKLTNADLRTKYLIL